MIQLFDEQIELLTDIKRTLEGLKQSATYKFESGAIESPVPTGSTVAPVPRTTWDKIHGIALLWYGDPNASFAKFFAIPGVALIAAPWWQPVLQQAAVHYLDVPPNSLAEADCKLFWSGWILVVIAVCLYIWLKQATSKIRHTAA